MEQLLSGRQVAKILSVSEPTVKSWERNGLLPAVRLGRAVRYRQSVIERVAGEGLNRPGILDQNGAAK